MLLIKVFSCGYLIVLLVENTVSCLNKNKKITAHMFTT